MACCTSSELPPCMSASGGTGFASGPMKQAPKQVCLHTCLFRMNVGNGSSAATLQVVNTRSCILSFVLGSLSFNGLSLDLQTESALFPHLLVMPHVLCGFLHDASGFVHEVPGLRITGGQLLAASVVRLCTREEQALADKVDSSCVNAPGRDFSLMSSTCQCLCTRTWQKDCNTFSKSLHANIWEHCEQPFASLWTVTPMLPCRLLTT